MSLLWDPNAEGDLLIGRAVCPSSVCKANWEKEPLALATSIVKGILLSKEGVSLSIDVQILDGSKEGELLLQYHPFQLPKNVFFYLCPKVSLFLPDSVSLLQPAHPSPTARGTPFFLRGQWETLHAYTSIILFRPHIPMRGTKICAFII